MERDPRSNQTANARGAPRCVVVKPNGRRCGSPALRHDDVCWQHREQRKRTPHDRPKPKNPTTAALEYLLVEINAGRIEYDVAMVLLQGVHAVIGGKSQVPADLAYMLSED